MLGLAGKGRRILEVGCGEGALAAALAAQGNEVVAIEREPALAEAASRRGVDVRRRDVEADSLADLGRFDVVVCADVLEHLRDPEAALAKVRGLLAPGGTLVVSIPNIAYYTVRLHVLRGRFDYEDGGIMDRTHLRFYTLKSARALLEGSGFQINAEGISTYLAAGFPPMTRALNRALDSGPLSRPLYKALSAFPGLFAYQFILAATPANGA